MNIEKELKNLKQEDERISNRYVLITMLIVLIITQICFILNEFDIFHVEKGVFRISSAAAVIFVVIPWIYYLIPNLIKPNLIKYVIVFHVLLLTLIDVSLMNVHATLILMLPLLVSTHYHSQKILKISAVGTCVIAVDAPFISLKLGTVDTTFLAYLIKLLNPDFVTGSPKIDAFISTHPLAAPQGFFLFYGFPHFLITLAFSIIVYTVNVNKNENLKSRVTEVKLIQDNILFSVADLIENRDLNTGTHVKRTSEVVKILATEIMKTDRTHSLAYWNSVIKAAPMHDLGKIAIPDSILQKPGKLTPEEFENIKTHAKKSADIISQVLINIETEEFLTIARNIAKYHHERFDGSGYPEHLKGTEIPLEARIMAIADVFDALVSERPYKKPQTPEDAYKIIEESMGSHFDPALLPVFRTCFPQLKEYYTDESQNEDADVQE